MAASPLRSFRTVALLAALTAGLFVGLSIGLGQEEPKVDPDKVTSFPDEGLTDAQRQDKIDQLRIRNANWVQEFVDQGRDPRDLPVSNLETYSAGATTLSDAREQSQVVIEGRVVSTTYVTSYPTSSLTKSFATVEVIRSAAGGPTARTIEVLQIGGPGWTEDGKGALVQLEGDPLLLPGQHVVLLLVPAYEETQRAAGRYQTVYGAGVYLVTAGGIRAPESNAFRASVNGRSVDEVLALFE
jgi:hypothetical protein